MPRPHAAQLACGSLTVVCSTLALLFLTGTPSGVGVVVIGVAALVLGLLVALTVPVSRRTRAAGPAGTPPKEPAVEPPAAAPARAHTGAESPVRQHSLRR